MSKYVFKNPEVEKALRLVCKELGVSDERFNEHVQRWSHLSTIWINDKDGKTVIEFSSSLLEKVEEFNLNDWNGCDVIPPKSDCTLTSKVMLVEDMAMYPHKGFYDFTKKMWLECGTGNKIKCYRFRLYPH